MPVCAKGVQQPDGSIALVLDPLATNLTACSYVVESGAELSNSLFALTAQDGGIFSAGVISVWIAAYCVRSLIAVIRGSTS
jgi:hypothetical protein